jgi:hypothetical protein
VRQIEAWIMADAERFAVFFRVRPAAMPVNPDLLPNAKQALLALIRHSRNATIRLDMLPREGSGAREGPAYSSRLIEFVKSSWRPKVAAGRSPSLRRCLDALRAVPHPMPEPKAHHLPNSVLPQSARPSRKASLRAASS